MSRLGCAIAVLVVGLMAPFAHVQVFAQDTHAAALQDIEQHVNDVNSMLRELTDITSASQASAYATALNSKVVTFLQHVRKVDSHGPELAKVFLAGGNVPASVVQARKHYDDMNQTVYPKLSAEMQRVENIYPNLKSVFDQIRNMHRQ